MRWENVVITGFVLSVMRASSAKRGCHAGTTRVETVTVRLPCGRISVDASGQLSAPGLLAGFPPRIGKNARNGVYWVVATTAA